MMDSDSAVGPIGLEQLPELVLAHDGSFVLFTK